MCPFISGLGIQGLGFSSLGTLDPTPTTLHLLSPWLGFDVDIRRVC